MIIDLKGGLIRRASITLSSGDRIYNARLDQCDIDDLEADAHSMDRCIITDCTFRSQWEAGQRLKNRKL